MSSFTNYLENAVLNHVFKNSPYTSPTTVYLALFTVSPTDAGGGTEVTGGGYARQAVTFSTATTGSNNNTAAVNFTAAGANFGTIVASAYFDALTGGNMLAWDGSGSSVINDGDTLQFPINNCTNSLD